MRNLPDKEIVYVCIPTTAERRARLQTCIDHIRANAFPHTVLVYENKDGGCVAAEHNMLQGVSDDALVFIVNDDMEIGPDCIKTLYDAYHRDRENLDTPPLLLQPFDNIHEGKIAVSPFCKAWVIKAYVHVGYIHNFNDTELTEVMRSRGQYLYVPEAKMFHRHGTEKNGLMDETYRLTSETYRRDRDLFRARQAAGFIPNHPMP